MNDDMFIRQPLDLEEYCLRRTWYEGGWTVRDGVDDAATTTTEVVADAYLSSFVNSNRAIKRVFPQHEPMPVSGHVPAVVRHDTLSKRGAVNIYIGGAFLG